MIMTDFYSKIEMMGAVEEYLKGKGFSLYPRYDPIFEPARVPIFGKKTKGEYNEVFVDIITEPNIKASSYFRNREFVRSASGLKISDASSAQFYRHYFPYARVYWAIPEYVNRNKKQFDEFIEKCRNQHIGLLLVKKTKNVLNVEELESSNSLMQERLSDLLSRVEAEITKIELSAEQKNILEEILEKNSHEDISYLAFYPEPKYLASDISVRDDTHAISRELINKAGELQNVFYRDVLVKFSERYYVEDKDDYTLALQLAEELWRLYGLEFPKLHKDFEEVLKLDPRYRDHFLHSIQVFLYGVYIIDQLYPHIKNIGFSAKDGDRIEDAWLVAATYHDYNYMIQMFDNWTKTFFESALYLTENNNPVSLQLSESYVKEGYMFLTKKLTSILSLGNIDKTTLDFLYDRILIKKNHGLISGLSLLKYLEIKPSHKLSSRVVNSASKAIAIHDSGIWEFLAGIADVKEEDKVGAEFKNKKMLEKIIFHEDPISFLLVLADSLQEEGRRGARYSESKAELEKLYFSSGTMHSEISFKGKDSEKAFKWKLEEMKRVKKFLDGLKHFVIVINDGNADERHELKI
jgi:hypothetical protein